MTPEIKAELAAYLHDAESKLADLPNRLKAEAQAAADADPPRKPFPVVPFTEVSPAFVGPALESIKDTPQGPLAETVSTLRKVCRNQTDPFCIRCDQLAAVLSLAKIKQATPEK